MNPIQNFIYKTTLGYHPEPLNRFNSSYDARHPMNETTEEDQEHESSN